MVADDEACIHHRQIFELRIFVDEGPDDCEIYIRRVKLSCDRNQFNQLS